MVNTYGQRNADLKPNVLLTKYELLCSAEVEIDNWKKEDKQKVRILLLVWNGFPGGKRQDL